jgi:hypothetical protein
LDWSTTSSREEGRGLGGVCEEGGRRPSFIALRRSRGYSTSPLYKEPLSTGEEVE